MKTEPAIEATQPALIPPRIMVEGKLHWRNTAGHLVPDELVTDIDEMRSDTVMEIALDIEAQAAELARKKAAWMADVTAFLQTSAEQHKVKYGGQKGNVTLMSYDGNYRLQIAVQSRVVFDERLRHAQQLLDEYFQELTHDASPEIRMVVQQAFQMSNEGNISASDVLSLQKFGITAPKWRQAMELIHLSIDRQTSGTYLRVSKKGPDGKYRMVPLFSTSVEV